MNHLHNTLCQCWQTIQSNLFPWLGEELGELTERQQQLVTVLELIRLEEHIPSLRGYPGRPRKDRVAIASAFVAKMVYNLSTTRSLLDRLKTDQSLRRLCGWEKKRDVPHESVFSRSFREFAESELPTRVHAALIEKTHKDRLVGHVSRDSTKIEAREKPELKKQDQALKSSRKRGRPKKGEERPEPMPTRLDRQASMTLGEMIDDLPKVCNVGTKQNSKGKKESWVGYKLHIDAADGSVPVSCLLTSASLHDSQAAIPLAAMTNERTTNLYDLMDSAYDSPQIHDYSKGLGHVPIIDCNPRRNKALKEELASEEKRQAFFGMKAPEKIRYNERSTVERINGRLKDEFGGRMVRVRGHAKVMCHLMFGMLALTVDQLMRFIE